MRKKKIIIIVYYLLNIPHDHTYLYSPWSFRGEMNVDKVEPVVVVVAVTVAQDVLEQEDPDETLGTFSFTGEQLGRTT